MISAIKNFDYRNVTSNALKVQTSIVLKRRRNSKQMKNVETDIT